MTGGILGIRKLSAIDEIVLPMNNSPLKRPRHNFVPVLGQTQQSPTSYMSSTVPDVGLQLSIALKLLADKISNTQFVTVNSQPLLSPIAPKTPQIQKIVEPVSNQPKDPRLSYQQREKARRIGEQKKMFAARKLSLVLDLDHTLLHSAMFSDIDPVHEAILRKREEIDRENPNRQLFRLAHMGIWTKLRPGIRNFLDKASKLFELHVNTMGNKLYATEMVKLLDPTGALFAGRVISRGGVNDDDQSIPNSKNLNRVLGMESEALIIDDTAEVWPNNKQNLIHADMYKFFPCSSRSRLGAYGPSLLQIGQDERPSDGTLASLLQVLERIHQNFFSRLYLELGSVRSILGNEQRKVLCGCRILFSSIIPVGEANPHLHPLWIRAEQFGAVCTDKIDDQVTHVVANSLGTEKVNWALISGRFVVSPGWVEASALLYRRAYERDFALKISFTVSMTKQHLLKPLH